MCNLLMHLIWSIMLQLKYLNFTVNLRPYMLINSTIQIGKILLSFMQENPRTCLIFCRIYLKRFKLVAIYMNICLVFLVVDI